MSFLNYCFIDFAPAGGDCAHFALHEDAARIFIMYIFLTTRYWAATAGPLRHRAQGGYCLSVLSLM